MEKVLKKLRSFISFTKINFINMIIGLIFILLFCPISLILRLFGYDPLREKKNDSQTFRELKSYSKINFKKLF